MLSEIYSTLGRHIEVIALREANLLDQNNSLSLQKEIPRTLCGLIWESARADNRTSFLKYANRLNSTEFTFDTIQQHYNSAAIVKGLVVLKLYNELSLWLNNNFQQFQYNPPPGLTHLIKSSDIIKEHPQVSTARALMRMYRKTGAPEKAIAMGRPY